jgi:hypothetical protein
MKARKVIIRGPFPTARDTAKLLGVSDTRLKELQRLRSSGRLSGAKKNGEDMEKTGRKVSSTKNKTRTNRHTASASRQRRARGKTAKTLS